MLVHVTVPKNQKSLILKCEDTKLAVHLLQYPQLYSHHNLFKRLKLEIIRVSAPAPKIWRGTGASTSHLVLGTNAGAQYHCDQWQSRCQVRANPRSSRLKVRDHTEITRPKKSVKSQFWDRTSSTKTNVVPILLYYNNFLNKWSK